MANYRPTAQWEPGGTFPSLGPGVNTGSVLSGTVSYIPMTEGTPGDAVFISPTTTMQGQNQAYYYWPQSGTLTGTPATAYADMKSMQEAQIRLMQEQQRSFEQFMQEAMKYSWSREAEPAKLETRKLSAGGREELERGLPF